MEGMEFMAKELSTQARWKPWKGVLLFVIALVWLIIASIFGVFLGGSIGTLVIQLGLLGIAIVACLINKTPLKEVFPVKKFTVRDFFGTVFMWLGAMPLGMLSAAIAGKLMPQSMENVQETLSAATSSIVVIGFIATVICPPICEEAIMRGAVLSNFRGIRKDWVIVLIIGVMFGILHMDTIRFVNTALMGGCLAYLVVKRNNILLAVIYHFINNMLSMGLSTITTFMAQQNGQTYTASEVTEATVSAIPSFMLIAALGPLFLVLGVHLIKRQSEISEGKEKSGMKLGAKIGISVIPCVLLLAGGIILTVLEMQKMGVTA